jgi:hypothetical protein
MFTLILGECRYEYVQPPLGSLTINAAIHLAAHGLIRPGENVTTTDGPYPRPKLLYWLSKPGGRATLRQ